MCTRLGQNIRPLLPILPLLRNRSCQPMELPSSPSPAELNLSNSPIVPLCVSSSIIVGPERAQLLANIQNSAFHPSSADFAAFLRQAVGVGAQAPQPNRAELYATATVLMAASQQCSSENATLARESMIHLLQNNSHHAADQLLIAGQIIPHLDASNPDHAGLREAAMNILSGRTANNAQPLNFASINSEATFYTAVEGLRRAFQEGTPETQEQIRLTMARVFRETQVHDNNTWREFRRDAGQVMGRNGNEGLVAGDSEGARQLRAAISATNLPAFPASAPAAPVVNSSGTPRTGSGTGGVTIRGTEGPGGAMGGPGGVTSGGPSGGTMGGSTTQNGGVVQPIGPQPIPLSSAARVEQLIRSPDNAIQMLITPGSGVAQGMGPQTIHVRFPVALGFGAGAGVPAPLPPGATSHELSQAQITQLIDAAGGPRPASSGEEQVPHSRRLTAPEFNEVITNLRTLATGNEAAVVQAAINLSQNQNQIDVPPERRQYLLANLQTVPTIASNPELIRRLTAAHDALNPRQ